MTSPHIDDSEFHALRELSAALGADPLRTQGAGGHTLEEHILVESLVRRGEYPPAPSPHQDDAEATPQSPSPASGP